MACLQAAFFAAVNGEGVGLVAGTVGADASLGVGTLVLPGAASRLLPSVLQPDTKETAAMSPTSQRVMRR
jgi:hypothetical protein